MLDIFQRDRYSVSNTPTPYRGELDNVLQVLQYNRDKAKRYYNGIATVPVKAGHPLHRLLNAMYIPMEYDLYRVIDLADVRGINAATTIGLTTYASFGKSVSGSLLPVKDEIYLCYSGYHLPNEDPEYWKTLQPVTVATHGFVNMNYPLLTGSVKPVPGIAVYYVDVVGLWLKYRGWALETGQYSVLAMSYFLRSVILPDLLNSFTDIALLNRITLHRSNWQAVEVHHPFYLMDVEVRLDKALKSLTSGLVATTMSLEGLYKAIPAVSASNALDAISTPSLYINRQTEWVLLLVYLPTLLLLLNNYPKLSSRSRSSIIAVKRMVRLFRNDKGVDKKLPPYIQKTIFKLFAEVDKLK